MKKGGIQHISHQSYGLKTNTNVSIPTILKKTGLDISLELNPDFYHKKFELFTIDDSREIKAIHGSKPFSSESPRVFVIEIHAITREAQNALLKIFEEPASNNFFFLMVPSFDILLPTLRSRLYILDIETDQKNSSQNTSDFLSLSLKEKIAFVDKLAESISDEKQAKHEAIEFLNTIERELYEKMKDSKKTGGASDLAHAAKKFEAISTAKNYLNDRAPSVKMLLEYVALSV